MYRGLSIGLRENFKLSISLFLHSFDPNFMLLDQK